MIILIIFVLVWVSFRWFLVDCLSFIELLYNNDYMYNIHNMNKYNEK